MIIKTVVVGIWHMIGSVLVGCCLIVSGIICIGKKLRIRDSGDEAHNKKTHDSKSTKKRPGKVDDVCSSCQQRKDKLSTLKQKHTELNRRFDELLAQRTATGGILESANDQYSSTKLQAAFSSMNRNQWFDLTGLLAEENNTKDELTRIQFLSTLMQASYEVCVNEADGQIRSLLVLSPSDEIPNIDTERDVYTVRRRRCLEDKVIGRVIEKVRLKLDKNEALRVVLSEEIGDETRQQVVKFFEDFTRLCWIMTLANPRITLDFDVRKQMYCEGMKERFTEYTPQKKVVSHEYPVGSIVEIVWPCMEIKSNSLVLSKGDVITVAICKE